jgi:hypothetical protein
MTSALVNGWVRLMVEIKTTEINPAHTDNSNTPASQELNPNINIVNTALVNARPIAERMRLRVMIVHSAEATSPIRIMEFKV